MINAKSLIEDAVLLKGHQRYQSAYTLFQLSIEELGKASILYFFATLSDEEKMTNLKKFKQEFLNHKVKTGRAINFDAIILSSINDRLDRHKFLYSVLIEHENIENFNNLKNYSLYTSIINDRFLLPSETISAELLEGIEARATMRYELIVPTIDFLLKGFDEVKKANLKVDNEQVKEWADEFLNDLLEGKI